MGELTTITRDGAGQRLRITAATWLDEANPTTNNDAERNLKASTQGSGNNKIIIMRVEIPTRKELGIPDKAVLKNITLTGEKVTAGTISLEGFRLKDQFTNFIASTATFNFNGRTNWTPKQSDNAIYDVPAGTWDVVSGGNKDFSLQPIIDSFRNKDFFEVNVFKIICLISKAVVVLSIC